MKILCCLFEPLGSRFRRRQAMRCVAACILRRESQDLDAKVLSLHSIGTAFQTSSDVSIGCSFGTKTEKLIGTSNLHFRKDRLDYPKIARLMVHSPEHLAKKVLCAGCTLKAAPKWAGRYRRTGAAWRTAARGLINSIVPPRPSWFSSLRHFASAGPVSALLGK